MTAETLLSRLEAVKQTGPDRWIARCPAHDDKTPSLAIRETEDGTVLLKCWAGCGAADVVAAVGLEMKHLFPWRPQPGIYSKRGIRRPYWPSDAVKALQDELMVVIVVAENVHQGHPLTDLDRDLLRDASSRLFAALQEVQG